MATKPVYCVRCAHDRRCSSGCAWTRVGHDQKCPLNGNDSSGTGGIPAYWERTGNQERA